MHMIEDLFTETDRVSHFYKCRILHTHSMTFALTRHTENMAAPRSGLEDGAD